MDASDVLEVRHAAFPIVLDRVYPYEVERRGHEHSIDGESTTHGEVHFGVREHYGRFEVQYWTHMEMEYARALTIVPHMKWRVFWATRVKWLTERVFGFM